MRSKETKTREEIWREVTEQCARFQIENPAEEVFASETYILKTIDASLPACTYVPQGHAGLAQFDIIVDTNIRGIGRPPTLNYLPKAVVVFGFAQFLAASHRGVITAWVGDKVEW